LSHSKPHPHAENLNHLLAACRVEAGNGFKLTDYPTNHVAPDAIDKAAAKSLLEAGIARLSEQQEQLYAHATWSLLIVFQAMDAGGKDSMVKHVMSGVNPQGVSVTSFKAPGREDLAHDFLHRVNRALPARGMIGVFNRSHYEEVVVTRVHPALLERQGIPARLRDDPAFWDHRLEDISCFERYLARQGTVVLKFFLHISKQEQKTRLLDRLGDPAKHWKFDAADLDERKRWDDYMEAYSDAIAATATPDAPWFVVPADRKWLARLIVVEAVNEALARLKLHVPLPSAATAEILAAAQKQLESED
jgi:PPK2 family polyphosphate:nucleotide phosphotransferase